MQSNACSAVQAYKCKLEQKFTSYCIYNHVIPSAQCVLEDFIRLYAELMYLNKFYLILTQFRKDTLGLYVHVYTAKTAYNYYILCIKSSIAQPVTCGKFLFQPARQTCQKGYIFYPPFLPYFLYIFFNDFSETNYLKICQTDFRKLYVE